MSTEHYTCIEGVLTYIDNITFFILNLNRQTDWVASMEHNSVVRTQGKIMGLL